MKIEAYQCQHCKKVFTDESKYNKCVVACTKKAEQVVAKQEVDSKRQDLVNYPRLNATSIEHLKQLVLECSEQLSKAGEAKTIEIDFDVSYSGHASNTHSAPIGGKSNFEKKPHLPTGYPALTGKCWYRYDSYKNHGFSVGGIRGINCGCGNGTGNNGYEIYTTLFLDDFPLIRQAIMDEQAKIQQAEDVAAKLYEQYNLAVTEDPVIVDLDKNISHLTNEIAKLQKDLSKVYTHKSRYVLDVHKQPLYDMYSEYKQSVGNLVYMKDYPMLNF